MKKSPITLASKTVSIDFVMSDVFFEKCNSKLKNPSLQIAEWLAKDLKRRIDKVDWLDAEIHCNIPMCATLLTKKSGDKNLQIVFREGGK